MLFEKHVSVIYTTMHFRNYTFLGFPHYCKNLNSIKPKITGGKNGSKQPEDTVQCISCMLTVWFAVIKQVFGMIFQRSMQVPNDQPHTGKHVCYY